MSSRICGTLGAVTYRWGSEKIAEAYSHPPSSGEHHRIRSMVDSLILDLAVKGFHSQARSLEVQIANAERQYEGD